jgi:archaellum component FlaC
VGKFIPVEPEKWAEMVKAQALVKEMDKTINASQAECRRLKEKSECQAECLEAFDKENARLKAEVERLNTGIQPEGSNDAVGRAVNVLLEKEKEIARLKAEVEHLQSENLLVREEADRYCRLWQEAKEGKQS